MQDTNLKIYGSTYALNNKDIREKSENTSLERFGYKYALQSPEIKNRITKTNIEKYGFKSPMQNKEVSNKAKQTHTERYGVEHALQHKEFFDKAQKSAFKTHIHSETSLKYQGKYEKHFIDYCVINNIKIENSKSIKYFYENKKRIYYPDFYLIERNLIIEIKSKYFYEKYLDKNLAKQKACIEQGYSFIFIIDKNYDDFNAQISKTVSNSAI